MIYLLGGYMWLFIHRPFEVWPVLGTLHVERVYMIVTILYWALAAEKTWIHNRLNVAFLFFVAAFLLSAILSPYGALGSPTVENYLKILVFYVLVMSSVRDERELKLLVIMFLGAMALYMAHSFREYLAGRHVYRMGVARMVGVDASNGDPNSFAATVLYSLPILYPLWYEAHTRWQRLSLLGYAGLAAACILLTGSRSGFAGLCALTVATAMLSKYRLRFLFLLVVAAPLIWVNLRADLQNRFLTLIDSSYGPANAQASAEGRTQGFTDGVRLWKDNPLCGVGPGTFGQAVGGGFQAHNLYGQVLGELGTLGAIGLVAIVAGFFGNALETRRVRLTLQDAVSPFSSRLSFAIASTVVFLLIMGWGGHNLYRYNWLWFGAFQAIAISCIRAPAASSDGEHLASLPICTFEVVRE